MGLGTLSNRSAGQTILDTFFNDIHSALNGSFVGRNTSGVPTSGQDLGTVAIPWGTVRATGLVLNGDSVDTSQITSVSNRVISGKTRSTSNQPAFITPNGAAASFILYGSTTSLALDINGSSVSVTTDITVSGLTAAPSSQNTCLLNDADAAGQADTKIWGEFGHKKSLTVQTMGTNITALVGRYATFKTGTEYFHAFVESSIKLSKIKRGYFYNSSLAPLNRTALTTGATITLMSTGWVFVEDNGTTVDVSYRSPVYGKDSPSSPSTGDYWYDTDNDVWKRYDGATFQIIDRTLVGMVVIDSANCVAARCQDFYADYRKDIGLPLEISTTEIVRAAMDGGYVSVAGKRITYRNYLPSWNITTDLANSADLYDATEQASRFYHLYVSDEGDNVISDIEPYYRPDLKGYYHPHNPWRRVGGFYNNASSNITIVGDETQDRTEITLDTGNGRGGTSTALRRWTNTRKQIGTGIDYQDVAARGGEFTCKEPGVYTITASDQCTGGDFLLAVMVNCLAGTTTPNGVSYANGRRSALGYGDAGEVLSVTWEGELFIGDVVQLSLFGTTPVSDSTSMITVSKSRGLAL